MARADQHLSKARNNEAFADAQDLTNQAGVEWAIIAAFYAALHHVEAYFDRHGIHCKDHPQRNSEIGRDPKLKRIFHDYRELQFLSKNARYECLTILDTAYTRDAKPKLENIKRLIAAA